MTERKLDPQKQQQDRMPAKRGQEPMATWEKALVGVVLALAGLIVLLMVFVWFVV